MWPLHTSITFNSKTYLAWIILQGSRILHLKRFSYALFWLKIRHIQAKECGLTFGPNIVWGGSWVKCGLFTSFAFNSKTKWAWIVLQSSCILHLKRHSYDLFWLKIRHNQAKDSGLTFDPNIHLRWKCNSKTYLASILLTWSSYEYSILTAGGLFGVCKIDFLWKKSTKKATVSVDFH
jgi:hypothetical protein